MMRTTNMWCVAVLCGSLLMGCGEGVADVGGSDVTQETSDALLNGVPSMERAEIGRVFFQGTSSCTATLIHPRVVITAKHCVDFGSCDGGGCENPRLSFETYDASGRPKSYGVARYRSLSIRDEVNTGDRGTNTTLSFEDGYALNDDVALVLLSEAVPDSIATPAKLATSKPEAGASLTGWGYGCTNRDDQSGAGTKRKIHFKQGQRSNALCPGDSGGPLTARGTFGELIFVNSGYWIVDEPRQTDIFGDVVAMRARIDAQMNSWGVGERVDDPVVDPPVVDDPVVDPPVMDDPIVDPPVMDDPVCRPFATRPPETGMPMRISLLWPEATDLDLFVEDPSGQTIYYGNRTTQEGAQLKKADCVSSSCPALEDGSDYSEWVEWSGKPLQGEYKVWAVNYNGRATANFIIQIESDRGDVSFEGSVSGVREASGVGTFTYQDREVCE